MMYWEPIYVGMKREIFRTVGGLHRINVLTTWNMGITH